MTLNIKVLGIGSSKSYCHGTAMVSLWFGESVLFDFIIICQSFVKIWTFICLSLDLARLVFTAAVNPATIIIVFGKVL